MKSVYDVVYKAELNNKYIIKVLSPKETFRDNKVYYSKKGINTILFESDCDVQLKKSFIFRCGESIKNILVLHKNEPDKVRAYFEGLFRFDFKLNDVVV
jgi:hypothetical protein